MSSGGSGIQRRRANLRRAIIATLVVACLAIMTGYLREEGSGPLHSVQSSSAGVMAPIQELTSRAVQPFRDGWNYVADLRDARERAEQAEEQVRVLRAQAAANIIREAELREQQRLSNVGEIEGYRKLNAAITSRSVVSWDRWIRINRGKGDGVVANSPVVVGSEDGAQLAGIVRIARGNSADVALITDGSTQVGAVIPESGNYHGLVQAVTPGQLRMSMVPKAARLEDGQVVYTAGFNNPLPSLYPRGLVLGYVAGHGARPSDANTRVQVTPFVELSQLAYVTVLIPESREALRRAQG